MIMRIVFDTTTGEIRNLLTQYGEISSEQVHHMMATFDGRQVLAAQHDQQLFTCIMSSLSQNAVNLIMLKKDAYRAPNTGGDSGIMLTKLVISESTLETKSTTNKMWGQLTAGMP